MEWFRYVQNRTSEDQRITEDEVHFWQNMQEANGEVGNVTSSFWKGTTGQKGHDPARQQIIIETEGEKDIIGDIVKCRNCEETGMMIAGNIYDTDKCPNCNRHSK